MPTNDTALLAIWFVSTFLHREFDHRVDGKELQNAKRLINPTQKRGFPKVKPYTTEEVKEALIALRDGTTAVTDYKPFEEWHYRGHTIDSLAVLFWKHGPNKIPFIDALLEVPDPPPVYEKQEFAEWVEKHGKRGLEQNKWDGVFLWMATEDPYTSERMDTAKLTEIVGEEKVWDSLEKWKEAKKQLEERRV